MIYKSFGKALIYDLMGHIAMNSIIKIVESVSAYNKELNEKIRKGTLVKPERGLVMTFETFRKVFSAERIRLLQRMDAHSYESIYQLAKDLGKPYEVVFRNLKYLEGMKLVKLERKDAKTVPFLAGKFTIEMFAEG